MKRKRIMGIMALATVVSLAFIFTACNTTGDTIPDKTVSQTEAELTAGEGAGGDTIAGSDQPDDSQDGVSGAAEDETSDGKTDDADNGKTADNADGGMTQEEQQSSDTDEGYPCNEDESLIDEDAAAGDHGREVGSDTRVTPDYDHKVDTEYVIDEDVGLEVRVDEMSAGSPASRQPYGAKMPDGYPARDPDNTDIDGETPPAALVHGGIPYRDPDNTEELKDGQRPVRVPYGTRMTDHGYTEGES